MRGCPIVEYCFPATYLLREECKCFALKCWQSSCYTLNGASACLRCLVFPFPGKLWTVAVRPVCLLCYSSAPGWIPVPPPRPVPHAPSPRLLLLHRSRNQMNCINLRLTSDPVFLSLGPNHHWERVLHFTSGTHATHARAWSRVAH